MKTAHTSRPPHIAEIDGLRAIAVLLVVIYHAVPSITPGGFIGVDIFFVISGYVIARSYLDDLVARKKSLSEFYLARIRRLAPAAFVMLTLATIAAALLISPYHFANYAWSLSAQPLWMQNFVFWFEGDYFDKALTRPLLHTWSLAAEEQFYLAWAILLPIMRWRPRWIVPMIIVGALVSLATAYAIAPRSPKTVFYLLPFRVWEFALGILAFKFQERMPRTAVRFKRLIALIGCIVLIGTGFLFTETSPFPGPQALIACGATAFLLALFDQDHDRDNNVPLISARPTRYIGEVSYGFYLYHWPPLALYYLYYDQKAPPYLALLLAALAFIMAVLSYRFIERPIRFGLIWPEKRKLLVCFSTATFVTICIGVATITSKGFVQRYDRELHPFLTAKLERGTRRCGILAVIESPNAEFCELSEKSQASQGILLLGDSHADVLKDTFVDRARFSDSSIHLTIRNCDLGAFGTTSYCSEQILDRIVAQAKANRIKHVVAISYFTPAKIDPTVLRNNITRLRRADMAITLVVEVPTDPSFDPEIRAMRAINGEGFTEEGIPVEKHDLTVKSLRALFRQMAIGDPEIRIADPAAALCNAAECRFAINGRPIYFDTSHLTNDGAKLLIPLVDSIISYRGEIGSHKNADDK